jgi:cholesterol oxidase
VNEEHFDAAIVGSGFGGSVMAYRLAEAGLSVCVLERGKAYPPGSFPRSPYEVSRNFWDPSEGLHGLFNVWSFPGLGGLVASGLGGGSLIYANVLLRKDPDTFVREGDESWPVSYDDLEPHYEQVERMLGAQRYPFDRPPYDATRKTAALKLAAERMGAEWQLPKLAVTFANPGEDAVPGKEIVGAPEHLHGGDRPRLTCLLTGECDLGCNYGSKNTLDYTYLSLAQLRHGAAIRPRCEVKTLAPGDRGYTVGYVDHSEAAEGERRTAPLRQHTLTATRLVLAAGTFGTNFLLLKNARNFPRLSTSALGSRFGGNGDLLTFLVKARRGGRPLLLEGGFGPVITSAIRVPAGDGRRGHYVEDAGYPQFVSWLVEAANQPGYVRRALRVWLPALRRRLLGRSPDTDVGAEIAKLLGEAALSSSSLPLLAMGRDIADGRFSLDDEGRLTTSWTIDTSRAYFREVADTARGIARALDADFRQNPVWYLSRVVTVHPLGGCPMGRDEREGVIDAYGRVFGYENFVIADGSVMPGPVGPNPSLTIAALADRFAERMVAGRPT